MGGPATHNEVKHIRRGQVLQSHPTEGHPAVTDPRFPPSPFPPPTKESQTQEPANSVTRHLRQSLGLLQRAPKKTPKKRVPREKCLKVSKNCLTLLGDF